MQMRPDLLLHHIVCSSTQPVKPIWIWTLTFHCNRNVTMYLQRQSNFQVLTWWVGWTTHRRQWIRLKVCQLFGLKNAEQSFLPHHHSQSLFVSFCNQKLMQQLDSNCQHAPPHHRHQSHLMTVTPMMRARSSSQTLSIIVIAFIHEKSLLLQCENQSFAATWRKIAIGLSIIRSTTERSWLLRCETQLFVATRRKISVGLSIIWYLRQTPRVIFLFRCWKGVWCVVCGVSGLCGNACCVCT